MTMLLAVNLVAAVVMLGLSIHRATGSGCALHFYPATIPTMVQAGLAAAVALVGVLRSSRRFACLVTSSVALGLLGLPAFYAMLRWPGGDDGGGFGWAFIVGGGCVASFVIAGTTMLLGLGHRRQEGQDLRLPSSAAPVVKPAGNELVPGLTISDGRSLEKQHRVLPGHLLLWGILGVAGLYLGWCVMGPISWTTTRTDQHAGGIVIMSTDLHELCPYPVPFYHHIDTDHERVLLVNGREVLNTTNYKDLFLSPGGEYVAAADWMHAKPIRIYSVAADKWVEVPVDKSSDEDSGHDYVYPFGFLRWDSDRTLLVEVTGTYVKGPGQFLAYRELWQVQADTGNATRIKRQEQPWQEKLKWTDDLP